MGGGTAALLLTGAPGTGKSSVLEKLATLLEMDGVAFGALESEQLGWGSPWLYGEPWVRQLRVILELQRAAGRRRFLIAATPETSGELAAVVNALGVDRVATVLLSAAPEVVAARIEAREPDSWPGKAGLVEHARALAASMPKLEGIDLRISTEGRSADEVAVELWDWLRADGLPSPD
jgi:adenylate kinase